MKHFEVVIPNGGFPLRYRSNTIAETFCCLMAASERISNITFDPDELLRDLVKMKDGWMMVLIKDDYSIYMTEGGA